jgi:hypothetical protein
MLLKQLRVSDYYASCPPYSFSEGKEIAPSRAIHASRVCNPVVILFDLNLGVGCVCAHRGFHQPVSFRGVVRNIYFHFDILGITSESCWRTLLRVMLEGWAVMSRPGGTLS